MGQLMQNCGEHFFAHGAVRTVGSGCCGAAIGQAGEQMLIQVQPVRAVCTAVGIGRHVIGPMHFDLAIELADEKWRQVRHRFVEQCLAGLLLRRAEPVCMQRQPEIGEGARANQRQRRRQQPDSEAFHSARMASARSWSLALRASGKRSRNVMKAASSSAPWISPLLAT